MGQRQGGREDELDCERESGESWARWRGRILVWWLLVLEKGKVGRRKLDDPVEPGDLSGAC